MELKALEKFVCDRYRCEMAKRHCLNRRAKASLKKGRFVWTDTACQKCEQGMAIHREFDYDRRSTTRNTINYICHDGSIRKKLVFT